MGLEKTARTFFFMNDGVEAGDVLSQREILIENVDDARSLYDKVTQAALDQLEEFVPMLAAGTFQHLPQDHRVANTWRKRSIPDGRIDLRMSAV